MFGKLKDAANKAARGISSATGSVEEIKKHADSLAAGLSNRAPTKDDIRKLLGILDYVPGIPEKNNSYDVLVSSLGIFQVGNISIIISHDGHEFSAKAAKLDKISVDEANEIAGSKQFSRAVISEAQNSQENSIYLITNTKRINEAGANYLTRKLLSAIIVKAIMFPIEQIPLVGSAISFVLEPPCELIVDFLVDISYRQFKAENDTPENRKAPSLRL